MSVEMNMDRIRRWKCSFCGSKEKRKIDAITGDNNIIGYSLSCCNCGHIDNFAISPSAIPMYVCGQKGNVKEIRITCALSDDDIDFCKNTKCPHRPIKEKMQQKSPQIIQDTAKNDMVIERKYQ